MALPPGPPIPAAAQTAAYALRPFETLDACARRYGDLFTLRLIPFGTLVCASRPETIKQIFTSDHETMRVGEANADLGGLIGEHSILVCDGEPHYRQRRLAAPFFFHGEGPAALAGMMCEVATREVAAWPAGQPLAAHERMRALTMEIVLRALLGVGDAAELDRVGRAIGRAFGRAPSPYQAMLMVPALRKNLGPLTPWASLQRDLAAVDEVLYGYVRRARAAVEQGRTAGVLGGLLAAAAQEGAPLSDAAARDLMVTMIIAGHETTSTTLCWAFESVLSRPAVAARIEQELRAVVGEGPLRPEHLPGLEYVEAVVKETLRIHPVVPILGMGRKLVVPVRVEGYELPAGVKLVPATYLIHRRPDLYPEPDAFRPERFLGQKPDPYGFVPFGGGVRKCLGMGFALQELKAVLAAALLGCRLRLGRRGAPRAFLDGVTIAPWGGTTLVNDGATAGARI